jgi:hypothetical protein
MKLQETFTNWDFINIWGIASNTNDGYPHLRVFGRVPLENRIPETPTNVHPYFGQDEDPQSTILVGSSFSDPDPEDVQSASQFQVTLLEGSFDTPAWDSGSVAGPATYTTVPNSSLLELGRYYRWRCRYQDDRGAWSAWSNETVFQVVSGSDCCHPMDLNCDGTITIGEVTQYGASWRQGTTADCIGCVTEGGAIWRQGETYDCDGTPSSSPCYSCGQGVYRH